MAKVELVPFPIAPEAVPVNAARYHRAIERHGFDAVADARLETMANPADPASVYGRILQNMTLAFSTPQLERYVRRELIEFTGRLWRLPPGDDTAD